MTYISDFISLFFPSYCPLCGEKILNTEKEICLSCLNLLAITPLDDECTHELQNKFKGRLTIQGVYAPFPFSKESKIQEVMHLLKYKKKYNIGLRLGNYLGQELSKSKHLKNIDFIIPIPIHKQKKKRRGYNQSEIIAQGICKHLQKPILTNVLHRKTSGVSQTQKRKLQRWENVKDLFEIKNFSDLEEKNILLVDDVITTGSTMQICSELLIKKAKARVFLCALAYAIN